MLKHLDYSVTFPTTGRTLSERIEFQKGFGAITGANGGGKSFSLEAMRWLLFGSAALRGKADDYKTLKGSLVFTIRGEDYLIERTRSNAKLIKGDELIVAGTSPVNSKVVQLLGFGLTVFDVACVANQGDIEKLGTMRPAERKQMVDSVIGLGVIEEMTRWAGNEANGFRRQAQTLSENLIEPQPPERPNSYRDPGELEVEIQQMVDLEAELNRAYGVADPGPRPTDITNEELDELLKLTPLVMELKALPKPSTYSLEYLDEQEALHDVPPWRGISQPKISRETIQKHLETHEQISLSLEQDALRKRIAKLESGATTCPACNHRWTEDDATLAQLKTQLVPSFKRPPTPPYTRRQLQTMLEDWDTFDAQPPKPTVELPTLSRAQIASERHKWAVADRRAELEEATKGYDGYDYAALKAQLNQWEIRHEQYTEAQKRIAELAPQVEGRAALQQLLTESILYDRLWLRYEQEIVQFRELKTKVEEYEAHAENWIKVKTALVSLRGKVKQHLVPSLSRVASHFIKQMTGGVKQTVHVDEDFEVLVDNQSLSTLSGSEKAVANLSLRLGLGQVLTNNIFSLFIGDEIDASMDEERAENTARTLRSLTNNISQILLVTHKYPEADYHISIGKTHGLPESNSGRPGRELG